MVDPVPAWLAVIAVLAVGLGAHELAHLAACRLLGVPGELAVTWRHATIVPNPCVRTNLRHCSAREFRLIAMAPLTLCLPVAAAGVASGHLAVPTTTSAGGLAWAWCLATLPSPPDWYYAARAPDDIATLHAVWDGPHVRHAAAEGV